MRILNFASANCRNCYKCLRTCPIKAIRFNENQAQIDENLCIACGQCFVVCPQNARHIKSDIEIVKEAIDKGQEVIGSLAPSFAGFFTEPNTFIQQLMGLGFSSVEETAIGAEYITKAYANYIEENNPNYVVTSCCPTINLLVERHYPESIEYMLPFVSPMIAHGKAIKKEKKEAMTVFIGPCISKKCEALNQYNAGMIDAVLTLEEVVGWIEDSDQYLGDNYEKKVLGYNGEDNGRSYPIVGGIANGLRDCLINKGYDILSITGLSNSKSVFEELKNKSLSKVFIEISACNESCIGGPAIPKNSVGLFNRKQKLKRYITNKNKGNEPLYFLTDNELKRTFESQKKEKEKISESTLNKILKKLGKYQLIDELNCGACGYNTCREKALAVFEGVSQIDMCMPYMRNKAESLSNVIFLNSPNAIFIVDEQLNIIDLNPSAKNMFEIKSEKYISQPIKNLINQIEWENIFRLKSDIINKRIQFNHNNLVGILNILYLHKENILLTIITNITQEEKRKKELSEMRENTLNIAQNVINKQMRVAQEIASLLGETTAETKVALTKLKEVVKGEEGGL
ncbi:iron only hydrogenase large subunit-like protein [Natranaerovirga pectinivora]|uniref:Iron only hydrogenase large subunit-like protein n=1 Tax=Natranaerovirga pectinivora TaxID=682400 RepID=A0A4R3MNR1_9FIRM|nr:[Fe-Fe] hydrogenase large subunit C-terminal domain-containing protein [Natranaerovirga pectinivora]TCT16170.1 iron only hydrogenase large subunit-like protein [Natranaerovirga pectinivora]